MTIEGSRHSRRTRSPCGYSGQMGSWTAHRRNGWKVVLYGSRGRLHGSTRSRPRYRCSLMLPVMLSLRRKRMLRDRKIGIRVVTEGHMGHRCGAWRT